MVNFQVLVNRERSKMVFYWIWKAEKNSDSFSLTP